MGDELIYDVGINNGDDTAYYLHPGFSVVAVEADPALVSTASERFKREIADGRLKVLNVAIAKEPGVLPFWISETNPDLSSFDRRCVVVDSHHHHQIDVQCHRLDSIIDEYGVPYYLKIDIEGADMDCLDSLKAGDIPKHLSASMHFTGCES